MELITTDSPRKGILLVTYNGVMGTVCDDDFGAKEAQVACNQLGFASPGQVSSVAEEDNM